MELHRPLHLGVLVIEKGAFKSPSIKVANFIYCAKQAYKLLLEKFPLPLFSLLEKIRYLCIYVTAIKPNFHERFRADNGKNRAMPKRLAN